MRTVVLVGDSIRLQYEAAVAEMLVGQARVVGPEDNCRSSRFLVERFDEMVVPLVAGGCLVHLNAGLHDLRRMLDDDGEVEVPLAEYAANLRTLVACLEALDAAVMLATTTPVDDARNRAARASTRRQADVDRYNATLRAVAAELGVPVDPLHRLDPATILGPDGVHLSDAGVATVAAAVAGAVRRRLDGDR